MAASSVVFATMHEIKVMKVLIGVSQPHLMVSRLLCYLLFCAHVHSLSVTRGVVFQWVSTIKTGRRSD